MRQSSDHSASRWIRSPRNIESPQASNSNGRRLGAGRLHDNLGEPERPACYGAVLDAAARHGARALVAVVDTGRTSWSPAFALKECAKYVWERVEMHLSRPAGRTGLIVADRPGGGAREEEALLADFLAMSSVGTGWVLPTNVALNILTTPSHLVRQLQLADIVTGATVAAVAGSRYAPPVFASVKPMFIKNALGYAGGTGLKLWPWACLNLDFHVLGEAAYTRASAMGGYSLPLERFWAPPRQDLDYFVDDGLSPT